MKIIIAAAAALLSGCALSTGELVSAKYCNHVQYTRNGAALHIEADCAMPYSAPSLPIPPAALLGL